MKERLYTEKETGALIQKAYALQQANDAQSGYGLTEQELRNLAEEMGIQPQFLEEALQKQDANDAQKKIHLWGAPLQTTQEKMVEGDVSEDLWEEMVHKLRFTYKDQGRVERVGNTRDWIYASDHNEIAAMSITSKNGRTRIRLREERYGLQLGLVFSTIFIFILTGIIGDAASDAGISGWLFGFLTLFIGYLIQRLAVVQSNRQPTKGEILLNEFSRMIEADTPTRTTNPETLSESPRISLPDEEVLIEGADTNRNLHNRSRA
ncbi:MAG TPA: hypothetical protein PLO56_12975 [Rhodothermales bacterium]|nr:hypothetical protein [Rhodothermales bacterium]